MVSYNINTFKNGIELYFDTIPNTDTRDLLKNNGWRWSSWNKCWYNKNSAENTEFAKKLCTGETPAESKTGKEKEPFDFNVDNLKKFINFKKWESGEWSTVATISRAVKSFLKAGGIESKTYTQRFSGGNSVDVYVKDLPFKLQQKLETVFDVLEDGNFDGMQDLYVYKEANGFPRTKYFFLHNELSKDFEKRAIEYANKLGFTNITDEEKIKLVFTGYIKGEDAPEIGDFN